MSSFESAHQMYLFAMKNGKKKIAYGKSPEDALEILAIRLTPQEMEQILRQQYIRINQRKLQDYVHMLG